MSLDRHPSWYDVVRKHWARTTGFVLASHGPCIEIRDQEIASVRGRALVGRDLRDLERWRSPSSWLLAVLVCPGEDLAPLAEWMRRERPDPSRIWFFVHASATLAPLKPWTDAGLSLHQVDVVSSWQELHRLFGLALNDQVYADWKHLESGP